MGSWKKSLLWGRYGHFSGIIQYKKVICYIVSGTLIYIVMMVKGLAKYVCWNKVVLYQGSFQYGLLLLGPWKSFVILRHSTCRGLLNQGSTVTVFLSKVNKFIIENQVSLLILTIWLRAENSKQYWIWYSYFAWINAQKVCTTSPQGLLELAYIYQCNMKHLL